MKTYQSKPNTVDAIQWTGKNEKTIEDFVKDDGFVGSQSGNEGELYVTTRNGLVHVPKGSYLSRGEGVKNFTIHDEEEFEASHEEVVEKETKGKEAKNTEAKDALTNTATATVTDAPAPDKTPVAAPATQENNLFSEPAKEEVKSDLTGNGIQPPAPVVQKTSTVSEQPESNPGKTLASKEAAVLTKNPVAAQDAAAKGTITDDVKKDVTKK